MSCEYDFTYLFYTKLVQLLKEHGYSFRGYSDNKYNGKTVILRHDVDMNLTQAVELSDLEYKLGVKSTYFVLVTSDHYNIFSNTSSSAFFKILKNGHQIGLHFDEMRYPEALGHPEKVKELIVAEVSILSQAIGRTVSAVSYHRPSKRILESYLNIPGLLNSYSQKFFQEYKYISDSRRHWREPVVDIIKSEKFDNLHILTHPFWYHDTDVSMKETLQTFINDAKYQRYDVLNENIKNMDVVLKKEEI